VATFGSAPRRIGPGSWRTRSGTPLTPAQTRIWEGYYRQGRTDGLGHFTRQQAGGGTLSAFAPAAAFQPAAPRQPTAPKEPAAPKPAPTTVRTGPVGSFGVQASSPVPPRRPLAPGLDPMQRQVAGTTPRTTPGARQFDFAKASRAALTIPEPRRKLIDRVARDAVLRTSSGDQQRQLAALGPTTPFERAYFGRRMSFHHNTELARQQARSGVVGAVGRGLSEAANPAAWVQGAVQGVQEFRAHPGIGTGVMGGLSVAGVVPFGRAAGLARDVSRGLKAERVAGGAAEAARAAQEATVAKQTALAARAQGRRVLSAGGLVQDLPTSRSPVTRALIERPADVISRRYPGAPLIGARARVAKAAGRTETEAQARVRQSLIEHVHALPKEGSNEDVAHFWWHQMFPEDRNVGGLVKVRDKLQEELQTLTSRPAYAVGSKEAIDRTVTARSLSTAIARLDKAIKANPQLDNRVIRSLGALEHDHRRILEAEGLLQGEKADNRNFLVPRWLEGAQFVTQRMASQEAAGLRATHEGAARLAESQGRSDVRALTRQAQDVGKTADRYASEAQRLIERQTPGERQAARTMGQANRAAAVASNRRGAAQRLVEVRQRQFEQATTRMHDALTRPRADPAAQARTVTAAHEAEQALNAAKDAAARLEREAPDLAAQQEAATAAHQAHQEAASAALQRADVAHLSARGTAQALREEAARTSQEAAGMAGRARSEGEQLAQEAEGRARTIVGGEHMLGLTGESALEQPGYIGHRMGKVRGAGGIRSLGVGKVTPPAGWQQNTMALLRSGALRQSTHVMKEDWNSVQTYRDAQRIRDTLMHLGEKFKEGQFDPNTHYLINPKGTVVPAAWKRDMLAELGPGHEDLRPRVQQMLDSFVGGGKNRSAWDAILEKAKEGGYTDQLRVAPKQDVERFYRQFLPPGPRTRGGRIYDTGLDLLANSLIFGRVGYVPKNIAQNLIMAFPHQGVRLLANLPRALQLAPVPGRAQSTLDRKLWDVLVHEAGAGSAGVLAQELGAQGARARGLLGAIPSAVTALADQPLRVSAVLHEAAAEGVIGKYATHLSEQDKQRLLDLFTSKAHEAQAARVRPRARDAMGDFHRLTPAQRRWARRFLIVPGWLSAGTRYPFHFAANYPGRSAALAYLAAGEPGAPGQFQVNRPITDYLAKGLPSFVPGIGLGGNTVERIGSVLPASIPADVALAMRQGGLTAASDVFSGEANPLPEALYNVAHRTVQTISGETKKAGWGTVLQRNLTPLAPSVTEPYQLATGGAAPGSMYQGGRLNAALRAIGVAPVQINKENALRESYAQQGMTQSVGVLSERKKTYDRLKAAGASSNAKLDQAYALRLARANRLDKIHAHGLSYQQQAYAATVGLAVDRGFMTKESGAAALKAAKGANETQLRSWNRWFGSHVFGGNVIGPVHSWLTGREKAAKAQSGG
jgi:hypothetical protein